MVRMEATAEDSFAAILARSKFGMAMAAIIRMIATTINNSIREKPLFLRIEIVLLKKFAGSAGEGRRGEPTASLPELPLYHVNLGTVLVKLHLVHQLINQKDSAPVVRIKILSDGAGRDRLGIETGAWVTHNNQDSALLIAGNYALHNLAR